MGLLDRFKKNNKKQNKVDRKIEKKEAQLPVELTYSLTEDGNLKIEFCDNDVKFGNDYNTTRLIVSKYYEKMGEHTMWNCKVSWYEDGETVLFNEETGKFENVDAENYIDVLAELDINLLQHDPNYCKTVMKTLLKKQDVLYMHEVGLQERPEYPCGIYIGGVAKTEAGYNTFFNEEVGLASHNSESMVNRRKQHKEELEAKRQKRLQEKIEQRNKLQEEIDDLNQQQQ